MHISCHFQLYTSKAKERLEKPTVSRHCWDTLHPPCRNLQLRYGSDRFAVEKHWGYQSLQVSKCKCLKSIFNQSNLDISMKLWNFKPDELRCFSFTLYFLIRDTFAAQHTSKNDSHEMSKHQRVLLNTPVLYLYSGHSKICCSIVMLVSHISLEGPWCACFTHTMVIELFGVSHDSSLLRRYFRSSCRLLPKSLDVSDSWRFILVPPWNCNTPRPRSFQTFHLAQLCAVLFRDGSLEIPVGVAFGLHVDSDLLFLFGVYLFTFWYLFDSSLAKLLVSSLKGNAGWFRNV